MSTPLLQQFPSLSSYPPSFLKDLLSSPPLTEAFLYTLPEVQDLAAEVEKLGRENEELARKRSVLPEPLISRQYTSSDPCSCTGRNVQLRDELIALRDTTAQAYAHAEHLKQRWAEIEKAQANLYQVSRLNRRIRLSVPDIFLVVQD